MKVYMLIQEDIPIMRYNYDSGACTISINKRKEKAIIKLYMLMYNHILVVRCIIVRGELLLYTPVIDISN